MNLRAYVESRGFRLREDVQSLRPSQEEALAWLESRPEKVLLLNAPTGSGKTIINAVWSARAKTSIYAVSTVALQEQVQGLLGLPVVKGRRHFACDVLADTTAAVAPCAITKDCGCPKMRGWDLCGYYRNLDTARHAPRLVANYAFLAAQPWLYAEVAVFDEGHRVESAMLDTAEVRLNRRIFETFQAPLPETFSLPEWAAWGQRLTLPPLYADYQVKPSMSLKHAHNGREFCQGLAGGGRWLVTPDRAGVSFRPVWGYEVVPALLRRFGRVLITSATLMGPDYMADTLGLGDSWAYYDLPSAFPVERHPVYFRPVCAMNAKKIRSEADLDRHKMQTAMDTLIDRYVRTERPWGLIHTGSDAYRDRIKAESRYQALMTSDRAVHAAKVEQGRASLLVVSNALDGWDGRDDLCRFILMPKVPFGDLGDPRTQIRREADPRSYEHDALVGVVQGVGRGMRHAEDRCDAYILDNNWRALYLRRREWLPQSFLAAYHHSRKDRL